MSGIRHQRGRFPFMRPMLRRLMLPSGIIVSSIGLLGSVGYHQGQSYVRSQLVPQIAADLSQSFNRPVQLGEVEYVSLSGIRLGASAIPATATDADWVTMEAVDIRFDLLTSLRTGRVDLDITLVRPQLWLDQDAAGDWLDTELVLQEDERITVRRIRIEDGAIALVPDPVWMNGTGVLHRRAVVELPSQVDFSAVTVDLKLDQDMEQIAVKVQAESTLGGRFKLNGNANLSAGTGELKLNTVELSTIPFDLALPPGIRFTDGQITTQLTVQLDPDQAPLVNGTATLENVAAWVEGEPNPFTETRGRLTIDNDTIQLTDGEIRYGKIPFSVHGQIHLQEGLDLYAQVQSVSVPDFMQTFSFELPVAATGALKTTNLRVTGPLAAAVFWGTVADAEPIQIDRVTFARAQTEFSFDTGSDQLKLRETTFIPAVGGQLVANADIQLDDGDNDQVELTVQAQDIAGSAIATLYDVSLPTETLDRVQATAQVSIAQQTPEVIVDWATQVTGYDAKGQFAVTDQGMTMPHAVVHVDDGQVQATGALVDSRWQAAVSATNLTLSRWLADLPGVLEGDLVLAGDLTTLDLTTVTGQGQAVMQIADSQLKADIAIAQGNWQSLIHSQNLLLQQFTPQLMGQVSGEVMLSGSLTHFDPQQMQIAGQVALPSGINQFRQPIAAAFEWQDNRLDLHQATAPGMAAQGWVITGWSATGMPNITEFDLALQVQDYDLAILPLELPEALQLKGQTSLAGRFIGDLDNPQLQVQLQVQNLAFNQIAFEPSLLGTVQFSPQGSSLDLAGQRDAIALSLDSTFQPQTAQVAWNGATAHGEFRDTQLTASIRDLPIEQLPLPPALLADSPIQSVGGLLSGQFNAELGDRIPAIAANIQIDRPSFVANGQHYARSVDDQLTAQFQYADGRISLVDSDLRLGNSRLTLQGEASVSQLTQATGELTVQQGDLQDVLWLAQRVLPHDVPLTSISSTLADATSNVTLLESLPITSRLEDWNGLMVTDGATETASALADLPLRGEFTGSVQLNAVTGTPMLNISLDGIDWYWNEIGIQSVQLTEGQWHKGSWHLPHLALGGVVHDPVNGEPQIFDTQLTLALNQQGWSGQLQADQLPLAAIGQILDVPVDVAGELTAIATLSGTASRPQLTANLDVSNSRIRNLDIQDFNLDVHYQDEYITIGNHRLHLPDADQTPGRIPYTMPILTALSNLTSSSALGGNDWMSFDDLDESYPMGQMQPKQDSSISLLTDETDFMQRSAIANQVIFSYGPFRPSFAVADLAQFAETGRVPAAWSLYFSLAQVDSQVLQTALTQTVPVDLQTVDHLLNSSLGKQSLGFIGQVLHTPSRQANVEAIRSALVFSAADDGQVSLLEFIQNYPAQQLHIDGARLVQLLQQLETDSQSSTPVPKFAKMPE
ncbi:MAG: alpha/beta hydrolase [Thainema sp.]